MPTTRSVFVDTSAILPLVHVGDPAHAGARAVYDRLDADEAVLVTSSYVVHESIALLQARFGLAIVTDLAMLLPAWDIVWIDRGLHEAALAKLLSTGARRVSLTDWSSFEVMRARGITDAFTLDSHFRDRGFTTLPA